MNGIIEPRQDVELDLDNNSQVLYMYFDLHLDLMESTRRLIGFSFVNRFYYGIVSLFSLFTLFG